MNAHYSIQNPRSLNKEQMMQLIAEEQDRRSKLMALIVAIVFHVGVVALLLFIVLSRPFEKDPPLIISAPFAPTEQLLKQKEFSQVRAEKPAAPSGSASKVIVSETLSSVPVPQLDADLDNLMDFGAGVGEGFGAGFGSGLDGSGFGSGTSFFGTPTAGRSVILVVDVSTSMPSVCGPEGIAAIRKEITRTINALRPGTYFNIICFGNDADGFAEKPVAATPAMKKQANLFMEDYFTSRFTRTRTSQFGDSGKDGDISYVPIHAGNVKGMEETTGGSRYDMALVAAFQQKPETIFLLTDGQPSTHREGVALSKREILQLVERSARTAYGRSQPVINCISIDGIGGDYLKDIAKAFKGTYTEIEPADL